VTSFTACTIWKKMHDLFLNLFTANLTECLLTTAKGGWLKIAFFHISATYVNRTAILVVSDSQV